MKDQSTNLDIHYSPQFYILKQAIISETQRILFSFFINNVKNELQIATDSNKDKFCSLIQKDEIILSEVMEACQMSGLEF